MLSLSRGIASKQQQRVVAAAVKKCQKQTALRYKSAPASNATKPTSSSSGSTSSATESSTTSSVSIPHLLVAATLGVGTVSATAAIVENATASSVPTFDPKGQRYDQDTFLGRFSRMLLACDPKLLFYTEEQVKRSAEMITNYKQYINGTSEMDRALWEARRIKEAALHPDTGDIIPRPFRMSGYITYNGPVCIAMVASQSTMPLLFWSWINQSQNALVNYYNRNASSPMSNETLMKSYAAAVGSALVVAFGLATVIQKKFEPNKAKQLLKWVAFPSAVVASSLNCYIVRSPEKQTGVALLDEQGHNVLEGETSQIAATRGVNSTTISRALLQAPVYFVPPVLISLGPLKHYLTKHPAMTVPLTTYLLLVSFGVGLPATVGIFPQISPIDAKDVEEKFQHLRHPKTNKPYETYYYNKGL